jgi:hypothetical protein
MEQPKPSNLSIKKSQLGVFVEGENITLYRPLDPKD